MTPPERHRTVRPDGKPVYLVPKKGHLLVCARGCCCGRTDRGNPAVPVDFYKEEYARRGIRKHVQLSMSGCIGPCPMKNVVEVVFDGRPVWFQSINTKEQVIEIYNYIDGMLAADGYLPPPPQLSSFVFNYYRWNHTNEVSGLPAAAVSTRVSDSEGGILFLTHADTDLECLDRAARDFPEGFPAVRALSLNGVSDLEQLGVLQTTPGCGEQIVVVRLLGSVAMVPGLSQSAERARAVGRHLIILSGTDGLDPQPPTVRSVAPAVVHDVATYLRAGGHVNFGQCLRFLADHFLMTGFGYDPPAQLPEHGIYHPDFSRPLTWDEWQGTHDSERAVVGVIFYRSHWLSGNLAFVDAIIREIERLGATALAVFTTSLKRNSAPRHGSCPDRGWPAVFDFLVEPGGSRAVCDALITTVSFAIGGQEPGATTQGPGSALSVLDVPVLQAICSSDARWQWEVSSRGLSPLDTAMNIALPEFDGRIITTPVSFKERARREQGGSSFEVMRYRPVEDRVARVAGLALRLARLRRVPNHDKRIAFVLTNSAGKAGRIGNAVGLDAPASLMDVLEAMLRHGYKVTDLPADGDSLIHALIARGSYDENYLTDDQLANATGRVPVEDYAAWFSELPEEQQERMRRQWGPPPGEAYVHDGAIALAGLELGNVLVALQPPRGYGMDPDAIYHRPDLPPPHNYYAFYRWICDTWRADAIVHFGKHGTLEWLPGKGVGLSAECFPDSLLADMPLCYPFIINDPGEGAQAKRRAHAVVIDHLVPPMTTADSYGPLAELTQLVDEYYQVERMDPSKLPIVQQQIWELIRAAHLDEDLKQVMTRDHGHTHEWDEGTAADGTPLALAAMQGTEVAHVLGELDAYLCELTGAQIRDGLHILGRPPEGEQLVGLLQAITRVPNLEAPSLRASVASLFGLELGSLLDNLGVRFDVEPGELARLAGRAIVTGSDALLAVDELCHLLLALLQKHSYDTGSIPVVLAETFPRGEHLRVDRAEVVAGIGRVLAYVCDHLTPALARTTDETANLLRALDGRHVPAGPSGAPTRGMAHILPTGRNFYTVDPRALPSTAAWRVGQELAREVLDRHIAETGSLPETVGISIWGTSAMRTHGDDVAQVLAFLGVRPCWQKESRRVAGFEVIPLEQLGRPRVDVVVRISGFFRDAFPHLIAFLDEAARQIMERDEPPDQNFPRKHFLADVEAAARPEACAFDLEREAAYRIFGSKPESYGAGILPLLDQQNWNGPADLADAYVNWGGYAYTADREGIDARELFQRRLADVQVALHNQDNREHDIFDSDDYLQFHGGMIATIRALTGRKPKHYFGDTHDASRPRVRDLKEEVLRVFRTRVINPKWLESISRHGYKGGLELSATVDYLFGFDATADVVDDWMYEQVAETYALDPHMQEFFEKSNPWALYAIAERLLEAEHRGMWSNADPATIAALTQTLVDSETMLEARAEARAQEARV
jgi:cobaltochelatase CobN